MNFISFNQRIKMLFFLTVDLMFSKIADALSNVFFAVKKKPAKKKGSKKPAKKKDDGSNESSDDDMGNDDGSFNSGQF